MSRPVNIVIAMVTLIIGYFLLGMLPGSGENSIGLANLIAEMLGFAFALSFANIHNDILDLDSDRLNRPERPLPSGRISVGGAKAASIVVAILTIACGILDSAILLKTGDGVSLPNFIPGIFFAVLIGLLFAYNLKLKHVPLLKNMTVAFLCATPLMLNWLQPTVLSLDALGKLYPAMMFAFLLTTAREILKDLEDEIGDLKAGIMTFPLIAGAPTARRLAAILMIFAWALLPLPVLQSFYPPLFLVLAAASMTPTLAFALIQSSRKNYRKSQSAVKAAMFLGLISLIACVLFS